MSNRKMLISRPLVQWITQGTAPLAKDLAEDGPIGAIAVSVVDAAPLESTIEVAHKRGLGTLIDTEASRTQLNPDHPKRAEATFRSSELDWLAGEFVPGTAQLNETDRNDIVVRHREAQVRGGATVLLSPRHIVRDAAPLSNGRRLELDVTQDFVELAHRSGATHPTPGEARPRQVAASLAVDAQDLQPGVIPELVTAYRELDVDLFSVWAWNFTPNARQYERIRFLCRRLQRESGKPVLVGGIDGLWEAALRNQVAAACQGWGRGSLKFPPADPPEPTPGKGDEDELRWGVNVFHPAIRSHVKLGKEGERILVTLFRDHPCPCGHHAADQPPIESLERHLHNRFWAEQLGSTAVLAEPDIATAELGKIVTDADKLRVSLGMGQLPTAWKKAAVDPSDAPRIFVPAELWRKSA